MVTFDWLYQLPNEDLESGIELLRYLRWHLKISQVREKWFVHAGECCLLKTDSKETMDAFLYGMALAYSVMPEDQKAAYRRFMIQEEGYDPNGPVPED